MDFYFNIRFDTWEEYSAFCAHADAYFQQRKPNTAAHAKKQKKAQPEAAPKTVKTVVHQDQKPEYQINGYTPSKALVAKVKEMIAKKQSFKAVDIAKGAIKNSNYKAKINKWLQAHPDLSFSYEKTGKRGKGALMYTPLENGKALLPPGEKPRKTDWPTKGASYRPSHSPNIDRDNEDAMEAEWIADFDAPDRQRAS